jgi:hypothetical protein
LEGLRIADLFIAMLELSSYMKPPNFGVETYLEAPAGVAIREH